MKYLADKIFVSKRFARSMNLERDVDQIEPLDGYIVTARALEVIERIAKAAMGPSGGAWSLTGPHGSGKSSLALLLDATFGPAGSKRNQAWRLIDEASPAVGEIVRLAIERHNSVNSGFHRGLVTAVREPCGRTLLRALQTATVRQYGESPSFDSLRVTDTLKQVELTLSQDNAFKDRVSRSDVVAIARLLAEKSPLLLIIDEFGKNLEAIDDGAESDPYLLQQLAEAGQGSGLPIFLLTLQHLSYEDHLADSTSPRRREWAKVQGRFEDISFIESSRQSRELIGTVFKVDDEDFRKRILKWSQKLAKMMRSLGVSEMANSQVIASCYPLHPLSALLLPELCNRYGQHERTLFSFLAGTNSASAASFLQSTKLSSQGLLPSLGLETVFDYFVSYGTHTNMASDRLRRWIEISLRLRDLHGLSTRLTRIVKSIALLNLVSVGGTIRASSDTILMIDADAINQLSILEKSGVVTFREYSDEYRIWQGTDVDILHLLEQAQQRVFKKSLSEVLSDLEVPTPIVAARHSAKNDIFRVFSRRYVTSADEIQPLDAFSPYDGEVLLVVRQDLKLPKFTRSMMIGKPVILVIPHDITLLEKVAREVSTIKMVLNDPVVESDWVARRELTERLTSLQADLRNTMETTFSTSACRWVFINDSEEKELISGRGSTALSDAADIAYCSTPVVGNEMLNRTDLTTQGSKARRLLLKAMIEHRSVAELGLSGYGPEVAMYHSFLARTGLHAVSSESDMCDFFTPSEATLIPAWRALINQFELSKASRVNLRDIFAELLLPPFGMKKAVIPVFVTAALLAYRSEIAIYEHGTFKPNLSFNLSERMVRNPSHFEIKHFANASGARKQVIDELTERLGILNGFTSLRVGNVLSLVGLLVSQVRNLDNFTRNTRTFSETTRDLRDEIGKAVEPDELLFYSLPRVLGFKPIPADTKTYSNAKKLADCVEVAVQELTTQHDKLLNTLLQYLFDTSAEGSRLAIMGQATTLKEEVLHPSVRAFVGSLANDSFDKDVDWMSAIATVVSGKAPSEWNDDDLYRFRYVLASKVSAFQRLLALHAERRADGDGPFDTLRVTVTRPDGSEYLGLVDIDQDQRELVDKAITELVDKFGDSIGSPRRIYKAMLAVLGDRIICESAFSDDNVVHSLPGDFKNVS